VPRESIDNLLARLDELKRSFGAGDRTRVRKALDRLAARRFSDADSLIRFHEILLFLRAHPHGSQVLRKTESILSSFAERVEQLRSAGADLYSFDYIEASGIAGTSIKGDFSYEIVRWLARDFPSDVSFDWESYKDTYYLGVTLPRLLPLLDEDSMVEANIPYSLWLKTAQGRYRRDVPWLLDRFERLPISHKEKAELYGSLRLPLVWKLDDYRAARTGNKRSVRKVYYHSGPLLRRSDVSLSAALSAHAARLERLSPSQGQAIIDMTRAATTVRYRELYGITNGDARQVVRAQAGRGVEIFLWGLAPERRLPLRGYHAGITLKNGVPINYIEGITLFERMEIGFNTFYTFREGESAWVYSQALRLLRQVTGAKSFSVDPYQIGHNNEEAIESGAFWFYRKLGFRPTTPDQARLVEREERKIAANHKHRTSARALRRLAKGSMIFEMDASTVGDWDGFHIRNLGLAVQRRMAGEFDGDARRIRAASISEVAAKLGARWKRWRESEREAFGNLALVLALIPDLSDWSKSEKQQTVRIIQAKAGPQESRYLRLLQGHARLRDAVRGLGS
jgi:hypothetical protein